MKDLENHVENPERTAGALSSTAYRGPEYWADWLVDAVATATQDRRFLRGDPSEDAIATEAVQLNALKAIRNAQSNLLSALEEAEDLLGFHEGSAEPIREGGNPVVWVNNEDLERVLKSLRSAISKARETGGLSNA